MIGEIGVVVCLVAWGMIFRDVVHWVADGFGLEI